MVLGQASRSAFSGDIVVFVAGADPLDEHTQTLFGWLREREIPYITIDVLSDADLGPKVESAAATRLLPILSANGRLIGKGSLEVLLRHPEALDAWLHAPLCRKIPKIWATGEAILELERQSSEHGKPLRLAISEHMRPELTLEAAHEGDWVLELGGVKIALDVLSLARADGVVIRWLSTEPTQGFVLENPNEEKGVRRIRGEQLAAYLESDDPPLLIDVRPEEEFLDSQIAGARRLDATLVEALTALDRSTPLAFYCENGFRSTSAARRYCELGFVDVVALDGGIQAWKRESNLVEQRVETEPDL